MCVVPGEQLGERLLRPGGRRQGREGGLEKMRGEMALRALRLGKYMGFFRESSSIKGEGAAALRCPPGRGGNVR